MTTPTLCLLTYDIPETANVSNPSNILYARGIRFNLSCWIIYKDQMPYAAFDKLSDAGATWGLFEFAPSANAGLLKAAHDALKRQIEDAVKRLNESLAKLDAKAPPTARDAALRDKQRAGAPKRLEKLLKQLEDAAKVYGIDLTALPLGDARQYARDLTAAGGVRARLASAVAAATAGTKIGQAVANDQMPLDIAADFLDDTGDEDNARLAKTVRRAFGGDLSPADDGVQTLVTTSGERQAARPNPANRPTTAPQQTPAGTRFSVRTRSGAVRQVTSTLTTREAAEVCDGLNDRFANELGGRYLRGRRLSPVQIAWMQILAVEANRPAPKPAAPQAPAGIPGIHVPFVITTDKLTWDGKAKTLTGEMSTAAPDGLPKTVTVKNVKTGGESVFTRSHEECDADTEDEAGELRAVVLKNDQGLTLRILND
jgi:hypothetical protein